MGYWILLFFLPDFILNFVGLANAQPDFLYFQCPNTGNYTSNSTYDENLYTVLSSLSFNIDSYGFLNASVGQNSDRVNAIVLCRGDVELDACRSCVSDSTKKLVQVCPNQKEAIGWYDNCMLRYSNRLIFGTLEGEVYVAMWNVNNVSEVMQFNRALWSLVSDLQSKATSWDARRKFVTTTVDGFNNQTMYGLWQCTPDLSDKQCNKWLSDVADEYFPICCNRKIGARILTPSCMFRFEIYPFYNETLPLPPRQPQPESSPPPPITGRKRKNATVVIIIGASASGVLGLAVLGIFFHYTRRSNRRDSEDKETSQEVQLLHLAEERVADDYPIEVLDGEKQLTKSQDLPLIKLDLIQAATQHFSEDNKLGQGGFGPVYKGTLPDGKKIAVKRLSRTSGQGLLELKNEVTLIARLQHRNLVRLFGCCLEGNESLLVYEFMPNKSLDVLLFDSTKGAQLDWKKRVNIIKGIARGLLYLHEDSRLKIIHRDLKVSNVLLDDEMNPKISDFGMARIFAGNQNEANTNTVVGTYGYMAPEYAMEGLFSVKSDVFSFGVLILEIVTGKKNSGFSLSRIGESLLTFAWKLWREGQGLELMDPLLAESGLEGEVLKCIHIGLLCVQEDPADRPTMSTVVAALVSDTISLPRPTQPAFSVGRTVLKLTQPQTGDQVCSVNEFTLSDASPR